MSIKITTLLSKINALTNKENVSIMTDFYHYMVERGSSENHIVNNLKVVFDYVKFLNLSSLYDVNRKDQVILFLNTKIKDIQSDPDKKWITTWNHYLNRIKLFFRWLHNYHTIKNREYISEEKSLEDWYTPEFVKIKQKQTKRLSPYLENEIWDREEVLTILKYEPFKRNKAIITLMWDLDARPHEITLLKIKNIRLRKNYGEGEIPHEAKTGSGPLLLTVSFPYVRDWLNEHPFKNESNARLICNLHNGAPISPKSLWNLMNQLKRRITRLLENGEIKDEEEIEKLRYLLSVKKWNPYCLRHSAITADSDYLPEYALKKKVRWSMNSKQGSRYIKKRMGNELKSKILEYNGITSESLQKKKTVISNCPRCELSNVLENKYCSKCSYPLKPEAFDEIKSSEEQKLADIQHKHAQDIHDLKNEMNNKFTQILSLIQQNPLLANIKPEVLESHHI